MGGYKTRRAKYILRILQLVSLRGSKSKIYFEDFKTSGTFLFLHFAFGIRASNVVDVMSYFASSSSCEISVREVSFES